MESFDFGLRLVDSASQPAKRITDSLRQVETQAKKTGDAVSGKQMAAFGKQFEKVGFAAARSQKKQSDDFAKMWEKVGLAAAKSQKQALAKSDREYMSFLNKVHREKERLEDKSTMGGLKEGMGMGKIMSGAFWGSMLAEGVIGIADSFIEGAKKSVEIVTEGIKKAFEEASQQETLRIGEKLSLGKSSGEYREDVGRFSKLTGFDDDKIRGMLLPMRRAGMDQQAVRTAFAAAGDVAAGEGRGMDEGRVKELLDAFTHIKLKGGIQERLLPGLGVDVKSFYADLGKSLKVNAATAKERAEGGKVDPQLLLNTIYKGIEKKQGSQLGTGNILTSNSFAARLAKVKNLPNEYAKGMFESPNFQRTSDALGRLLEQLDPDGPTGKRIMASFESMFDRITGFIGDPVTAADSLAQHIETAVDFTKDMIDLAAELADAFLPTLDTVEDMVIALRQMKAALTTDVSDDIAAEAFKNKVDQRRIDRRVEGDIRQSTPEIYASKLKTSMLEGDVNQAISGEGPLVLNPLGFGGALLGAGSATASAQNDIRRAGGSSKATNITVPKIEVNIHGPVDDSTAAKVGAEVHRATTTAMENAATGGF
jgi:hypothetical protein